MAAAEAEASAQHRLYCDSTRGTFAGQMAARPFAKLVRPAAHSGRSRPLFETPGIEGYGAWRTFVWDNRGTPQHGVALAPAVPPWRQLFTALDDLGASLPDLPPTWLDEADAITACCWRFGSYFHVLTGGDVYPPFRADASLSRIGDHEMRRINIEFSAALSAWLTTRTEDPSRVARRARAALLTLPMPWRNKRPAWWADGVVRAAREHVEALERTVHELRRVSPERVSTLAAERAAQMRLEANAAVLACYRNGPIEDLHAGMWSHGREVPGFLRLHAREVARLERDVARKVALHLLQRDGLTPEASRIAAAIGGPRDWSLTQETSTVAFLGVPGGGSLEVRLRDLASRYPHHFSGAITAGHYDVVRDRVIK